MTTATTRRTSDILRDYAPTGGIFSDDDERTARVKYIIWHRLSAEDRKVILLYAELGSYRELGRRMGMSHTAVRKYVLAIRARIYELL